jgi:hypothetical protein
VEDEHALIIAERDANNELHFTLHAIASVHKGYREYREADLPLEEKVQYQMGNRIFEYVQDIKLT